MTKKEDSKRARNRGEIDREGEKKGGGVYINMGGSGGGGGQRE